jgi:hypothetical protein
MSDCIFVAFSTMTLSGTSLPGPTPWCFAHPLKYLSQQLTLRVVGTNIFHRLDWISVAEPHQRRPNGV